MVKEEEVSRQGLLLSPQRTSFCQENTKKEAIKKVTFNKTVPTLIFSSDGEEGEIEEELHQESSADEEILLHQPQQQPGSNLDEPNNRPKMVHPSEKVVENKSTRSAIEIENAIENIEYSIHMKEVRSKYLRKYNQKVALAKAASFYKPEADSSGVTATEEQVAAKVSKFKQSRIKLN